MLQYSCRCLAGEIDKVLGISEPVYREVCVIWYEGPLWKESREVYKREGWRFVRTIETIETCFREEYV